MARLAHELDQSTRVVGVRDLDWYYGTQPPDEPVIRDGNGWILLDLPCKELENLLCDVDILHAAYEQIVPRDALSIVLEEESNNDELLHEWRINVQPRIRKQLENRLDDATKEQKAIETFNEWSNDHRLRAGLVAGKPLLGKVRERIKRDHGVSCYPTRVLERVTVLTPPLASIASAMFPNSEFPKL